MMAKEKKALQEGSGRTYQTPRGHAATAAKNKYRDKNYDRAELVLPKGMKTAVREIAGQQGQSFNEYVCTAVMEKMERDSGEKPTWEKRQ